MKVKTLIRKLKKMPPDATIVLEEGTGIGTFIEIYDISSGHFDGDTFLSPDDFKDMKNDPEGQYPVNAVWINT